MEQGESLATSEILIRLPSARSFLLRLPVRIRSVISTAWEWCMIMPCMKLMSASAGARGGVRAVAGERVVLLRPGAPGCTMGALLVVGLACSPDAAAALRMRKAAEKAQTPSAMNNYTTWYFAGSTKSLDRGLGPG